jgi:hypothetical protein
VYRNSTGLLGSMSSTGYKCLGLVPGYRRIGIVQVSIGKGIVHVYKDAVVVQGYTCAGLVHE